MKNTYSESGDQVWKEFGTQSKITADASVQCNIPIEPEKPKTFDACTQCCNIGKFSMKLTMPQILSYFRNSDEKTSQNYVAG